jgi:hypothetical protein
MKELIRILWLTVLFLLAACGSGGGSGGSQGNPNDNPLSRTNVTGHWSHIAIDASGFDHSAAGAKENLGPTKASRAMAIVHIAMHDAAQAIQQRYETYLPQPVAPATASLEAAIGEAAYEMLTELFPSQRATFEQHIHDDLTAIADGPAKDQGVAAGHHAAQAILADRADDGSDDATQNVPYHFSDQPGRWRVDPLNPNQQPLGSQWGKVRPFVLTSASQFRAPPPPAIDSNEYAEAYAEIYRLGGDGVITPTERTEEQTEIGIYWAYDGTPSLCAPPRLYNQLTLQLALDQGINDPGDLARLFALVNVASADAAIASWETKFYYDYWRPVTAIREADPGTGPTGKGDGNPLTIGDPDFTPLGAPASNLSANNFTPPFPTYVSGHGTFGGAVFETLRKFFGRDDISFTFVSDELNGVTQDHDGNVRPLIPRSFSSLSQAEDENGQSRLYLGIHWSFDKVEGIRMGNKVADWVFSHKFRPK